MNKGQEEDPPFLDRRLAVHVKEGERERAKIYLFLFLILVLPFQTVQQHSPAGKKRKKIWREEERDRERFLKNRRIRRGGGE